MGTLHPLCKATKQRLFLLLQFTISLIFKSTYFSLQGPETSGVLSQCVLIMAQALLCNGQPYAGLLQWRDTADPRWAESSGGDTGITYRI